MNTKSTKSPVPGLLILAGLLAVTIVCGVGACNIITGGEPGAAPSVTVTSMDPDAAVLDAAYLAMMRGDDPLTAAWDGYSDDALIDVGLDACYALDTGWTLADTIYGTTVIHDVDTESAGYVVGVAIAAYCPRYGVLVDGA